MIQELSKYNVIFKKPGLTDRSNMPIGNGEIGVNLWVEENSDLKFYFTRSDCRTQDDEHLKLGMCKISISPNPFEKGKPFHQELVLEDGYIKIIAGNDGEQVKINFFVDKEADNIYITCQMDYKATVKATYYNWRVNSENSSDTVKAHDNGVLFYHNNGESCIKKVAEIEALEEYIDKIYDPLKDRIFGGYMSMQNAKSLENNTLGFEQSVDSFDILISTQSEQNEDLNDWIKKLVDMNKNSVDTKTAFNRSVKWWNDYWNHSWIFVNGDKPIKPNITDDLVAMKKEPNYEDYTDELSQVTRSYIITKYMFACNAYGEFPLYFNGLLFNTTPGAGMPNYPFEKFYEVHTAPPLGEPTESVNPDARCWGNMTLWQNIRLPYHSMLQRDETDSMKILFSYYRKFWDINKEKAKKYYDAKGQYNTEITMSCGLMPLYIYGENREGIPHGYADNRWGGAVDISPGLELTYMMLDYYNYTKDNEFLFNELLPYAKDIFRYIETRFKERKDGKIVLYPLQCVENYWDTKNPITVVAGMRAVIDKILKLPKELNFDREFFEGILRITPPIQFENVEGKQILSPADEYVEERKNVEPVTLYATFPFENYTFYKPEIDMAINSYYHEVNNRQKGYVPRELGSSISGASYSGWQYAGMTAALLGLTDNAKEILENNCAISNPGYRFPAMWGPVYDSVPDVDHGANILTTLQLMAFKVDGEKIYILPSWPNDWDVSFKFYADKNTVVELDYKNGKIEKLGVTPKIREKDIVIKI